MRKAQASWSYLVLQLPRHHRLRHSEGNERSWLPASNRRFRVRRSTDSQEHQEGRTVQHALDFARDCLELGLVIHGDFILGLPGETKKSIRNTIEFAKRLDCETIQVSMAHAFPGTELYEHLEKNGLITNGAMSDEAGHQMVHIEYPGLPAEYVT
jgi:hypothetical protein